MAIHSIYFLFDKRELVYVGMTDNLKQRLIEHKRDKIFDFAGSIIYSYHSIKELELWYIRRYQPRYNKIPKIPIHIRRYLERIGSKYPDRPWEK